METNLAKQEETAQDTVIDLDKLTGDEIETYLKEAQAKESQSGENAEAKEEVSEGAAEKQNTTEETAGEKQPTLEEILAERDRLQKVANDKETFIQKQAKDIGVLRKQTLEFVKKSMPTLDAEAIKVRMVEDPDGTLEEIRAHDRKLAEFREHQATIEKQQTEATIKGSYPNFDELIPEIEKIALVDGVPAENIRNFLADPYSEDLVNLAHYAKRAEAARKISSLEAQLEAERKKSAGVVEKIDQATKTKTTLTNKTGTAAAEKPPPMDESQLENLEGEALDRELERRLKEEFGG